MQPPTSLQDRTPLDQQPFKTMFCEHLEKRAETGRFPSTTERFTKKVADALDKIGNYQLAVDAWFELAFEFDTRIRNDDGRLRQTVVQGRNESVEYIKKKQLWAFVVFYWCMCSNQNAVKSLSVEPFCVRGYKLRDCVPRKFTAGSSSQIPVPYCRAIETTPSPNEDEPSNLCTLGRPPGLPLSEIGFRLASNDTKCSTEANALLATPPKRKASSDTGELQDNAQFPVKRRRTSSDDEPSDRTDEKSCSETASEATNLLTHGKMKETHTPELKSPSIRIPPPKPALPMNPPIWAKSRQEICETLGYFQSYQGGVYFSGGEAKGYLLGGFGAPRDRFAHDGKLIISHGGGKAESLSLKQGKISTKSADDQRKTDPSVSALLHNYRTRKPLVLLVNDSYAHFPFSLKRNDIYIAVLGFYRIVHAWAESVFDDQSQRNVVRWKFAFQWCDNQDEPWWSNKEPARLTLPESMEIDDPSDNRVAEHDEPDMMPMTANFNALSSPGTASHSRSSGVFGSEIMSSKPVFRCVACGKNSPIVYARAQESCLNPDCIQFWKTPSDQCLPDNLEYDPNFLQLVEGNTLPDEYHDRLIPSNPSLNIEVQANDYNKPLRGWHCKRCGRVSCRVFWNRYICPHCKDANMITATLHEVLPLKKVRVNTEFMDSWINHQTPEDDTIQRSGTSFYPHSATPDKRGNWQKFTLPYARGEIYHIKFHKQGGEQADEILGLYQQQAWSGELRLRRTALKRVIRGEMLTGYFSQNSGEKYQYVAGTGDTVPFSEAPSAVLTALEYIKTQAADAVDVKYKFNEVLTAGYMQDQKMGFHGDNERGLGPVVASLSLGAPARMDFRPTSKVRSGGGKNAVVLSLNLRHGDVLIMDGADIQKEYEHAVFPLGFRIAATARWIEPEKSS